MNITARLSGPIAVGLAAFVVLATAPTARADPADDNFLRALTSGD